MWCLSHGACSIAHRYGDIERAPPPQRSTRSPANAFKRTRRPGAWHRSAQRPTASGRQATRSAASRLHRPRTAEQARIAAHGGTRPCRPRCVPITQGGRALGGLSAFMGVLLWALPTGLFKRSRARAPPALTRSHTRVRTCPCAHARIAPNMCHAAMRRTNALRQGSSALASSKCL